MTFLIFKYWRLPLRKICLEFKVQYGGAGGLIAIRVLEGLGEGTTFPALNTLVSAWIPVRERSKAGALIFGGSQVTKPLKIYYWILIIW